MVRGASLFWGMSDFAALRGIRSEIAGWTVGCNTSGYRTGEVGKLSPARVTSSPKRMMDEAPEYCNVNLLTFVAPGGDEWSRPRGHGQQRERPKVWFSRAPSEDKRQKPLGVGTGAVKPITV